MATPEANDVAGRPTKITFRFCRECSNMLYPREDKINNTLMFACRTCQFSEPATSSCVFRNELSNTVGETAGITQDVGSDPTVGNNNSDSAAFFLPVCTMCGQEIVCEECGDEDADLGLWLEVDDGKDPFQVGGGTGGYEDEIDEDELDDDLDDDMDEDYDYEAARPSDGSQKMS